MKKNIGFILLFTATIFATSAFAGNFPWPGQPDQPNQPNQPGQPGQPGYPGNPQPPGYNDIYGPGRTVRWWDMGTVQAQKFIAVDVRLDVRGQFVNEIFLAAIDNHVGIKSAQARLANGQMIDLRYLVGTIQKGRQYQIRLDYNYSLRIDSLYLTIESPNLAGSRASLAIQLGLAY